MSNPDTDFVKTGTALSPGSMRKSDPTIRILRSCTYTIDLGKRLVFVKFVGILSFSGIEDYASHLRADKQFSPSLCEIVDLRGIEQIVLSPAEAIKLADSVDPFSPKSRRAFVVRSHPDTNSPNMHRILRPGGSNIRVFSSLENAESWVKG